MHGFESANVSLKCCKKEEKKDTEEISQYTGGHNYRKDGIAKVTFGERQNDQ